MIEKGGEHSSNAHDWVSTFGDNNCYITLPGNMTEKQFNADLNSRSGRALIEEHYWSVRRQTPIVYLLGLVNLSAMEIAATGTLTVGAQAAVKAESEL